MKNFKLLVYILFGVFVLTGCAGLKTMTIQTQEPAQVTLPKNVSRLLIVDNTVGQPYDMGHTEKRLGKATSELVSVTTDSLSIILTEALTQFLSEEEYFDVVMLYEKPLRNDREYWNEAPIEPETMLKLKKETGADAVVSLDKLLVTSDWEDQIVNRVTTNRGDFFEQGNYPYATLSGKIAATMRVYLPNLEGQLPTVRYVDSLYWEGFDISDGRAYADFVVPHAEFALKDLAMYAADKLTYVLTPHWVEQERWYYTLPSSSARKAEAFAAGLKWQEALEQWESFFNSSKSKIDKAKTACNIALANEMLDDITTAHTWILKSQELFNESTSSDSLERKRVAVYKRELERRLDNSNKLNMQID